MIRSSGGRRAADLGEGCEELVGVLLGHAVDEAGAELGDLAAHIGFHIIRQQGAAALDVGQAHIGAALGEARDAAFARTRDAVAVRGIKVAQLHIALEGGRNRANLDLHHR